MADTNSGGGVTQLTLPTDPEALLAYLQSKVEQGKTYLRRPQMKLQLAYVLGFQWVVWDVHLRSYRRPRIDTQDPNAPVRITSNKIASLLERNIAKLTKELPEAAARPVSDDDNDVDSARVATRILSHEQDRLDWEAMVTRFMFWPGTLGFSYMQVSWDPDDGKLVGNTADITGHQGEGESLFEGNVQLDIVPGYELYVDPSAMTMDNARWAIRTIHTTREDAWVRWGVKLQGDSMKRSLALEVLSLGGQESVHPSSEYVHVHQFWMVPNKAAPQGAVITWAGNEIIERKVFPYDHHRLPFVQMNWLPGLGTREGRTFVTDLISLQTDYNDALSREATIRRTLTPKMLAPAGSIDPERVTSRVETIIYNPVGKPPTLELPSAQWAQQFELGMNRDSADMSDRAGIGDASAGQAAGTSAAASIMALQEADDTKLSLTAKELKIFIEHVGWQILMLTKQYWSEERTVRVWSEEDILAAYRYTGADISDQVDIHVDAESALPKSKSARMQLAFELQARGFFQDPQDFIRFLDLPGTDFIIREADMDTKRQWRETSQMLNGEDPVVQPWDDHLLHLKALNNFRKTTDYDHLPPEMKGRIDGHAAVHESLVLKQRGVQVPSPVATMDPAAAEQANTVSQGPNAAPTGGGGLPPQIGGSQMMANNPMGEGSIMDAAGIGAGAGAPGQVPGIQADQQAAAMGR